MVEVAAVVVAAGRGIRAGGGVPKQFRTIGGEPMLRRALAMLIDHPQVGAIQPVIHPDDVERFRAIACDDTVLAPVFGGATRQASVRAGLEALKARKPDIVLIHDAARPFASPALIAHAIETAIQSGAAVPGLRVSDTVKSVDADGTVSQTLDRNTLRLIQTPQAFAFQPLLDAHARAAAAGPRGFHRRRRARRMGRLARELCSKEKAAT